MSETWAKMIIDSEKPLALVYVCNEILVNCVSGKVAGSPPMVALVKLMETRTSESFKKLCSQPGKLNQKTFESLLRTLDVWLKRQIYSSSHIETLVQELKGLYAKSEEQRKAAKSKVRKQEIKANDFQHLVFQHTLGMEFAPQVTKQWFELADNIELSNQKKIEMNKLME